MSKSTSNRGFTIVELLIVIVVIAILAAISIVAYSGVQNRAKTTAGNELASQVAKKIGALNAVKGTYFSATAAGVTGAQINTAASTAPAAPEATLDNESSVSGATSITAGPSAADNGEVVYVWGCDTGATVLYWDYTTNAVTTDPITVGDGCS